MSELIIEVEYYKSIKEVYGTYGFCWHSIDKDGNEESEPYDEQTLKEVLRQKHDVEYCDENIIYTECDFHRATFATSSGILLFGDLWEHGMWLISWHDLRKIKKYWGVK